MKALLVTTVEFDKYMKIVKELKIIPWERVASIELTNPTHHNIEDIDNNISECCTMQTINMMDKNVVDIIQQAREKLPDIIVEDT